MKFKGTKEKWHKYTKTYSRNKVSEIKTIDGISICAINTNIEESESNANLISKAPEMFEMLKECIEYLRRADGTMYHNCADRAEIILTEAASQAE